MNMATAVGLLKENLLNVLPDDPLVCTLVAEQDRLWRQNPAKSILLYINDLNNVSTLVELILFADDTNIFMSHKDPVYLAASLNSELTTLSTWFKANKLSLNLKKTNSP